MTFEDTPPLFDENTVRALREDRRIEDPLKVGPTLLEPPKPRTPIAPIPSVKDRLRSLAARVRVRT